MGTKEPKTEQAGGAEIPWRTGEEEASEKQKAGGKSSQHLRSQGGTSKNQAELLPGSEVSKLSSTLRIVMTSYAHQRPLVILINAGRKTPQDASHQAGLGPRITGHLHMALAWMSVTPGEFLPRLTVDMTFTSHTSRATTSNTAACYEAPGIRNRPTKCNRGGCCPGAWLAPVCSGGVQKRLWQEGHREQM